MDDETDDEWGDDAMRSVMQLAGGAENVHFMESTPVNDTEVQSTNSEIKKGSTPARSKRESRRRP
jgi:hypothetical protein